MAFTFVLLAGTAVARKRALERLQENTSLPRRPRNSRYFLRYPHPSVPNRRLRGITILRVYIPKFRSLPGIKTHSSRPRISRTSILLGSSERIGSRSAWLFFPRKGSQACCPLLLRPERPEISLRDELVSMGMSAAPFVSPCETLSFGCLKRSASSSLFLMEVAPQPSQHQYRVAKDSRFDTPRTMWDFENRHSERGIGRRCPEPSSRLPQQQLNNVT